MNHSKVGFGKSELNTEFLQKVMLGYGNPKHKMFGSTTNTYTRCLLWWDEENRPYAIFCFELAFITGLLYETLNKQIADSKILEKYNTKNRQIILLAQHTHTNIGGYSGEFLYNVPNGGLQIDVLKTIVDSAYKALHYALKNAKEQKLYWFDESIPKEELHFVFNRSIKAYKKNGEFKDFSRARATEEFDPRRAWDHRALMLIGASTEPLSERKSQETHKINGICHFFALHTNSLSNKYTYRHADHKGLTALQLESKDLVALLAQSYCGDNSPNSPFLISKNDRHNSKTLNEKHTQYLANKQFFYIEKSLQNFSNQIEKHPLNLLKSNCYVEECDLTNITIDDEFLPKDALTKSTVPPALGAAFIVGSPLDGPSGVPAFLANFLAQIANTFLKKGHLKKESHYFKGHYPKKIFIHPHFKFILHPLFEKLVPLLAIFDETMKLYKNQKMKNLHLELPWIPTKHFFQLLILGDVAIFTIPFEITTMAGSRLEKTLLKNLAQKNVKRVQVMPYANNFAGYITTHEEYDEQMYEGGHTVFGRNSLGALQTIAKKLSCL